LKTKQRDQEQDRIASQLETATNTVFGVLREAKERNDLTLILETLDRVIALIELRGKLTTTLVKEHPAVNGTAPEESATEGGGGHA
jgi:hypothetical protein